MEEKAIVKVSNYMHSDVIKARFAEVVGSHNAGAYISSVILAVANSAKLQECSTESIYISAMRAATLRLSVDPSTGQAYLVPFKGKATLIVGYKGFYDMAVRTGKYRFINVAEIFEGEEIVFDRISGAASLGGGRSGDKAIGWVASFEMRDGFSKTICMSVEEIHAHAKKYSKNYGYDDSVWKTNPTAMERKTVLRILLHRYGYMDPADISTLESIEAEPEAIDVEAVMSETAEVAKKDEEQIMAELGYEKKPGTKG